MHKNNKKIEKSCNHYGSSRGRIIEHRYIQAMTQSEDRKGAVVRLKTTAATTRQCGMNPRVLAILPNKDPSLTVGMSVYRIRRPRRCFRVAPPSTSIAETLAPASTYETRVELGTVSILPRRRSWGGFVETSVCTTRGACRRRLFEATVYMLI